jgi:transposase
MRALVARGVKKRTIAEAFGVSPATVTRVTK